MFAFSVFLLQPALGQEPTLAGTYASPKGEQGFQCFSNASLGLRGWRQGLVEDVSQDLAQAHAEPLPQAASVREVAKTLVLLGAQQHVDPTPAGRVGGDRCLGLRAHRC